MNVWPPGSPRLGQCWGPLPPLGSWSSLPMQELSSGPVSQVEKSRLSCRPGRERLAQPELTQKERERFKAARQPPGGHSPAPAPSSLLAQPQPTRPPRGPVLEPSETQPSSDIKEAARLLPTVFRPDHSHPDPSCPGPSGRQHRSQRPQPLGSQCPGPSHVPASPPQHVPSPWPGPAHWGGPRPQALPPPPARPPNAASPPPRGQAFSAPPCGLSPLGIHHASTQCSMFP